MRPHHKRQRTLLLAPVAAAAVAAVFATPLLLAHPETPTHSSAKAVTSFKTTAQNSAIEREFANRANAAAAASRSNTRLELVARGNAERAAQTVLLQQAREQAAKAARLEAIRQAKAQAQAHAQALAQLRLQKIRAAEKARLDQVRAAAVRAQQLRAQASARKQRPAVKRTSSAAHVGSPKAYAQSLVGSGRQYGCLVQLWNRESGWNYHASNSSSGAYGIPQALPGSKMASAGADWRTNPATQVRWGLRYISSRYGTPCGAWAHSQSFGWY
jgi:hypothetical protein